MVKVFQLDTPKEFHLVFTFFFFFKKKLCSICYSYLQMYLFSVYNHFFIWYIYTKSNFFHFEEVSLGDLGL